MKTLRKIKLNSKGFGHVEMVLVIAVVVAVAGVGVLVASRHTNKAHAITGYTSLGNGKLCLTDAPSCAKYITYTGYACLLNAGGYGTYVRGAVIAASAVPKGTTISLISYKTLNVTGPSSLNWTQDYTPGGWLYGTIGVTGYHLVNLNATNYIQINADSVYGDYATNLATAPRAGQLVSCTS